uniref:Uncharacterized protein n=1 Tax=Meloidogyne enterolobii TaxID=390850 RepID=A0A6V7U684_MELEN|nr:unnamed protein product [Meloidogyne enterolobii]
MYKRKERLTAPSSFFLVFLLNLDHKIHLLLAGEISRALMFKKKKRLKNK